MTFTKYLTVFMLAALAGTVLLDVRLARRRRFGLVFAVSAGYLAFAASVYAILMEFITRM